MSDKITSIDALQRNLGVNSWPALTKDQTFELLKLAGEEKLTTSVLSKVVELAPMLQQLATECFETFRENALSMRGSQSQALAILDKAIDSFDRFRASLLEAWKTVNDPDRLAELIKMVSRQMIEVLQIVERMNAENNRSWLAWIGGVASFVLGAGYLFLGRKK